MQPKRRVSVDGFVRRPAQVPPERPSLRPAQTTATLSPTPASKQRLRAFAPPGPPPRGLGQRLQLPLVIVGGLIIGFFMQSLLFGLALIFIYGLLAQIFKVPSRVTFVLSLLSLIAVILLLLVKRNPEQSGNFATYTFLLLVVGVVSLALESRQAKPHYKKR